MDSRVVCAWDRWDSAHSISWRDIVRLFDLLEEASSTLRYHAPFDGITISPSLLLPLRPSESSSCIKSHYQTLTVALNHVDLTCWIWDSHQATDTLGQRFSARGTKCSNAQESLKYATTSLHMFAYVTTFRPLTIALCAIYRRQCNGCCVICAHLRMTFHFHNRAPSLFGSITPIGPVYRQIMS